MCSRHARKVTIRPDFTGTVPNFDVSGKLHTHTLTHRHTDTHRTKTVSPPFTPFTCRR